MSLNLIGQTYGRLAVTEEAPRRGRRRYWQCICSCGSARVVAQGDLRSGNTKSCGCLHAELSAARARTHGKYDTQIYHVWRGMLARCQNPNNPRYADYGGRGITVCERWQTFENFYADMGESPKDMTLDRKDNSKNYCESNCQWASYTEQNRNKRSNRLLTLLGESKCLAEWAEQYQIHPETLSSRIKLGWTLEEALNLVERGRR